MSERVNPTIYGIRRAEVWLDMYGAAVSSLPMAEALASYAAPLETGIEEANERVAQLARELEEMVAERNAYVAEIEGEREGRLDLRRRLGARDDEIFSAFIERLAEERDAAMAEDARKMEDRIVERVLNGVAEMITTELEMLPGQWRSPMAIKSEKT